MRFEGTLKSWNDDKGFGFISPSQGGQAVNVRGTGPQQAAYQPDRSHRPVRISRSGNSASSATKTVVALLLVAVLGWQGYAYYQKVAPAQRSSEPSLSSGQPLLDLAPSRAPTVSYVCDGRQHCSQMTSCAEATYFLKNCPGTKMDGDNDGVPCETQLCK